MDANPWTKRQRQRFVRPESCPHGALNPVRKAEPHVTLRKLDGAERAHVVANTTVREGEALIVLGA